MRTKEEILDKLLKGPSTAGALASVLRIQKSAVRRHLEELQMEGSVSSSFKRNIVGRPAKFYYISVKGRENFQTQYDALLERLLTEMEEDSIDLLENYMEKSALYFARQMRKSISGKTSVDDLRGQLQAFGFSPLIKKSGGRTEIYSYNCPLLKLAQNHQEMICLGFHTNLLGRLLNSNKVQLKKSIALGDQFCLHTSGKSSA
ncbi:MAG: ArsR family transcriptional regulator [Nitrososphaerota archaeon]|jgi:DeoR family suf operon transcriptional repressor|nr:ArsR family transcriptional regulator [Nitrososphaerota archaeon]